MRDSNTLTHLSEFRALLDDYKMSEKSKLLLKSTKLVLLAATTSSGRNTLIRQLIKTDKYHYIVSDTTRQPRINDGILEQNGVEYWFRSEQEILEDLRRGNFLEAAIIHDQQVSGINIRELDKAIGQGKVPITDMEVVGVEHVVEAKPDTLAIFVLPPSFEEWQRRIKERGDMSQVEFRRRLTSAAQEFEMALSRDYYIFVVNDLLDNTTREIDQIVLGGLNESPTLREQIKRRELTSELLRKTKQLLANI